MATAPDQRQDSTAVARGLTPGGEVRRNLSVPALYMQSLKREEGVLAEGGPLVVDTGHHTGRSPNDKFVVREPSSEDRIWWGKVNQPLEQESYDGLREKIGLVSARLVSTSPSGVQIAKFTTIGSISAGAPATNDAANPSVKIAASPPTRRRRSSSAS